MNCATNLGWECFATSGNAFVQTGRYAEIRVTFHARKDAATGNDIRPILYDLTLLPTGATTVISDNRNQLAVDDQSTVTRNSGDNLLSVLENDQAAGLNILSISSARHGSAWLAGGQIHYTPPTGFSGEDRVVYTLGSAANGIASRAIVRISVSPNSPNQEPFEMIAAAECRPTAQSNPAPLAVQDELSIRGNFVASQLAEYAINVIGNDFDPDGGAIRLVDDFPRRTTFGRVRRDGETLYYTPGFASHGTDVFNYTILDDEGQPAQGKVTVRVSPADPPVISITAPTPGNVPNNSQISLTVNVTPGAIDVLDLNKGAFLGQSSSSLFPNGAGPSSGPVQPTIKRVEYYANGKRIGEATAAPWNFTWKNVQRGSYSLAAVATDDLGLSGVSGPVNITAGDLLASNAKPVAHIAQINNLDPPAAIQSGPNSVDPASRFQHPPTREGILPVTGRAYDTSGGDPVKYQFLLYVLPIFLRSYFFANWHRNDFGDWAGLASCFVTKLPRFGRCAAMGLAEPNWEGRFGWTGIVDLAALRS